MDLAFAELFKQRGSKTDGRRIAGFILALIASVIAVLALQTNRHPANTPTVSGQDFSANPKDGEFLRFGSFAHPLVPVGPTSSGENRELSDSLVQYEADAAYRERADNVTRLTTFIEGHPTSSWRPVLLLNVGMIYRHTGHFSKALRAFDMAWSESKAARTPAGREIGDAAIAELTQMQAYLGRKDRLAELLAEIRDRPVRGAAAELISASSRGLAHMTAWPEKSFRCGPLALLRILLGAGHPSPSSVQSLVNAKSTANGLPLTAVRSMAADAGMAYQMAFRAPGAAIVTPAVAHWKVGHYAAIVGKVGDRYRVEDSTFGQDIQVSAKTIDEEASGYFLIPAGPMPRGWRAVDAQEGARVWGRGDTGSSRDAGGTGPMGGDPAFPGPNGAPADPSNPNAGCGGCTTWNVEPMSVSLELHDRPIGYRPPVGPAINFDIYYSHRDVLQPAAFNYVNLGNKWTLTWLSYVTDNSNLNKTLDLYQRGGGDEPYTISGNTTAPGRFSQAVITRTLDAGNKTSAFVRRLKDGSSETFSAALGNKYFMTLVTDPQGNSVKVDYDSQMRIASVTDAIGQSTSFTYGSSDPLKITKITDPFGRSASFEYNTSGQLVAITDVLGIRSSYAYGAGDFITALTTPYGTSSFVFGDSTTDRSLGDRRFLNITDALGRVSRVEFSQSAPSVNYSDPAGSVPRGMNTQNQYLNYRNSFIWNPAQYALATASGGLDYSKARLIHWLHTPDYSATSRVVESSKEPLESRVWRDYPGQPSPIAQGTSNTPLHIGRVLDDGTTQLRTFTYNAVGNVASRKDPVGRTVTYAYDSTGIDLLSIINTTGGASQPLANLTYNSQHRPLTITGADGYTTTYTYNSFNQPVTFTDALGNVTTYNYDKNGFLTSIKGPASGATYIFTYNTAGQVASATDPAGRMVMFSYDSADRVTGATYPDGTMKKYAYTLLDLTGVTDRLGQTTQYVYDAQRQLTKITDPLNQAQQFAYAPDGKLASITDGNGHATMFAFDGQDRLVKKTYADGTTQTLAYEAMGGRVLNATDALKQVTAYTYNADNSIAAIAYTNAPNVSFAYDPAYRRLASMTDGNGTTAFAYYATSSTASAGGNRLKSVTSPVAGATGVSDTVTYTYDAVGRVTGRMVDGTADSVQFDPLGRVMAVTNALDTFTYSYADATDRASAVASAHGPQFALTYFDGKGDELIKTIKATASGGGAMLAQYDYQYDANDNVTKFSQAYVNQKFAALSLPPVLAPAGTVPSGPGGAVRPPVMLAAAALTGPPASGGLGSAAVPTALLATMGVMAMLPRRRWPSGVVLPVLFAVGLLTGCSGNNSATAPPVKVATASAQVTDYSYDKASRLTGAAVGTDIAPGPASAPQNAYGYDAASNLTSIKTAAISAMPTYTSTNAIATGMYDANGSPTTLDGKQYSWDGANRLVKIATGSAESDFSYDGLGRLVRIVEKQAGAVTADRAFGWCGQLRCVERDNRQAGSPVVKRFFDQGVMTGTTPSYYVADRLGSVRQTVDAAGKVTGQLEYDPYGNQSVVNGSNPDVGFGGLFLHGGSGIYFAVYRGLDPGHGRWLNRDPTGEKASANLYEYAESAPNSLIDRSGDQAMVVEPDPFEPPPPVRSMNERRDLLDNMGAEGERVQDYYEQNRDLLDILRRVAQQQRQERHDLLKKEFKKKPFCGRFDPYGSGPPDTYVTTPNDKTDPDDYYRDVLFPPLPSPIFSPILPN